ncbi:toxic anion resistance protein [Sphingomonas sp. 1P06PA]|uniref:toxic anion resistance protein n=1 Tax=Sphingomonas sp. 1P06PA TaxID=554121 RepID=UPI0039A4D130
MTDFSLDPPDPIPAAATRPARDPAERAAIEDKAARFVRRLLASPIDDPEFIRRSDGIAGFGQPEMEAASALSARLVDRPAQAIQAETALGADLDRLGVLVAALDPAANADLLAPRRLFGLASAPPRLPDYFRRFEAAEPEIAGLLRGLITARDSLLRDNAAIDGDRERLKAAMAALDLATDQARALDAKLDAAARELAQADPQRAASIRDGALLHARGRTADLLTMAAVAGQGWLALDLIRRNNLELIKAIDRIRTVTLAALSTAVAVARALGQQRLALDRIAELDRGIAQAAERTAARLTDDASQADAELARLTASLGEARAALAIVGDFRVRSLASLGSAADALASGPQRI